jgi:hypothetical protein
VLAEEPNNPAAGLQARLLGVEVDPVDPFDVQLHFVHKQLPDPMLYHCQWPRLTLGLRVLPPPRRLYPKLRRFVRSTGAAPTTRRSEAEPR